MPSPLKRVVAICADSVMMPLALWAALSLKAGGSAFSIADWPAYLAVVAIYGAGDAGARLSTALLTTRAFDPLVFVDDKKALHGRMVNGIKVYPPEQLPALIKDRNIDRILLALPTLTRRRRREILNGLE